MLKSTSSSAPPPSSCPLNPCNHASKPPIISSPSLHNFHAHCPPLPHPNPHSALLIPVPHCHHAHIHSNLDPPHHQLHSHPQPSITVNMTDNCHGTGLVSENSSSHSFNTDPHCYTTDCSPRSVICQFHSSSSAPSPDPGRYSSSHSIRNAGSLPPSAKSHNLAATYSSMNIIPHHPALHETNQAFFSQGQSKQVVMQSHPYVYPPWSSPGAVHHQSLDASSRSVSANSERLHGSYRTVAQMQSANRNIHHEAETEKGNNQDMLKVRRSPKLAQEARSGSSNAHDREGQCPPNYSSGSAAVDKPCVSIVKNEPDECDSGHEPATKSRLRSDTESDYGTHAHTHRYRALSGFMNSSIDMMQSKCFDQRQRTPQDRSYSCDLHTAKGGSRASSRHSAGAILQQAYHSTDTSHTANATLNELYPKSPDALLGYVDRVVNHHHYHHPSIKGCMQFGSKWEDAERWLRPANHHQYYPTGCRGLIPNLGVFRMSDCMNSGTAIRPHYMNPLLADATCARDYVSANSSCNLSTYTNHSLHAAAFSSADSHNDYSNSGEEKTENHPYSANKPSVHVDCFAPHLKYSCSSDYPYMASSAAPHLATEQASSQIFANPHQFSDNKQNQGMDHSPLREADPSRVVEWNYMVPPPAIADQLTDRLARGDSLPFPYANSSSNNIMVSSNIQQAGAMPMVSLREIGTQMSSIDGSGSISRYTSKNGSPQKALSPARHNTPARLRSLSGSASTSGNQLRRIGAGKQQLIDWDELLECHRAKLELQALSEGDRIRSFHRTASNWSSREAEEADLSRSLRYSTPELENLELEAHHSKEFSHQWPTQSCSWNNNGDSTLAKLKLKEAQIQAWEQKIKSKADAKLKRLEENLAKKRSQTTTRIMENLAAAQRKAEEMRASVYAQQRRSSKKGQRLRPRSLSPLSHCTCFSALQ